METFPGGSHATPYRFGLHVTSRTDEIRPASVAALRNRMGELTLPFV